MENEDHGYGQPPLTFLHIPGIFNTQSIDNWLQCHAKKVDDGPTRKNIFLNAKQHLAFMNWKVGYTNKGHCYFISPDDEHMFSDLLGACLFEKEKELEKKDDDKKGFVADFPLTFLHILGIYDTESIDNWLQCHGKNADGPTRKGFYLNAKQHLAFMNWKIGISNMGHFYFISPDEYIFSDLFGACLYQMGKEWGKKDVMKEEEKEMGEKKEEDGDEDNGYILTCSLCNTTTELQFEGIYGFCSESCSNLFTSLKEVLFTERHMNDGINFVLMQADQAKPRLQQDPRFGYAHHILTTCFGAEPTYENMIYSMEQYSGFNTSIIQVNGIVASTAMLRFHTRGQIRMVEIPLVGTHADHRRKNMCRYLFKALEYHFTQLGISEIILPAAKNRYEMWRTNFGFSRVRLQELQHRFGGSISLMMFDGTILCSKRLGM